MKQLALSTLFLLSCLPSFAQRSCGAMDNLQHQLATDPGMATRMEAIENQTQHFIQSGGNHERVVITIPVVFHIIHNGDALGSGENISDTYVMAQLDQLNKHYRKLNSDASLIPAAFLGVTADAEIRSVAFLQAEHIVIKLSDVFQHCHRGGQAVVVKMDGFLLHF